MLQTTTQRLAMANSLVASTELGSRGVELPSSLGCWSAAVLLQEKEDRLVQRDSSALDLDQLRVTLDACTLQAVSLEQRNELLRSRMMARRREIEVCTSDVRKGSCCLQTAEGRSGGTRGPDATH